MQNCPPIPVEKLERRKTCEILPAQIHSQTALGAAWSETGRARRELAPHETTRS